ncbi:putative wall-associated receptor kinase-like 16 [Camellia sinensis]|uniref:putative wall-associated receptor kinase-like 16 n=1 Tax=Camellia sinensis TaxID=4442 RepID=UPI00103556F3|nr:putative wall-associated receptor kinase-like 16 [Camellia sinensis]
MDFHGFLFQLTVVGAILAPVASLSKPDCSGSCGNLNIPFPFGTSPDCYLDDSFLITCNSTDYNPPKPFLWQSNLEVLNLSLDGLMSVSSFVARDCFNKSGAIIDVTASLTLPNFFISSTHNKFVAVGCDTVAVVEGSRGQNYATACVSLCNGLDSVENGTCSGIGCCKNSIPKEARDFAVSVGSLKNHSQVLDFNPCGYAFVVEEDAFNFSTLDLKDLQSRETVPVVLDWAVGNQTCQEALANISSYACKAMNSECYNASNGPGYLCRCSLGYQGNPYVIDGCQDINECEVSQPCKGTCMNLPGSFSCSCPKDYEGDGMKNGTGCHHNPQTRGSTVLAVGLGLSLGLLSLFLGSSWIYWILRKRKHMKLREKFFQQNGGLMLQQQLSKHERSVETATIFTAEDLKKATNNYDESEVIGRGGFGTVYRGVLPDHRVVAIKKSKISDQNQIDQFINEVIVLAQINHRNVVKLLGCCLETEVPLLVYEFITNGTLSEHIHDDSRASFLTWEMRLKIAAETAGALAYLHSATSTPIIHRDIKTTNLLLDDNYTAKVADFGASRLVPLDHSQLATLVQGTFGYLDPEYFHSSQLTEKSDVYSFGVVLAELLTGKKALSFDRPEKDRNLATYFISAMKEDRLFHILERRIVNEGKLEQIKEVAKLAKRCLRVKAEERPSMKEAAMELDGMRIKKQPPWEGVDLYPEEIKQLLNQNEASDGYYGGFGGGNAGSSTSAGYDSMRDQMSVALDGGR